MCVCVCVAEESGKRNYLLIWPLVAWQRATLGAISNALGRALGSIERSRRVRKTLRVLRVLGVRRSGRVRFGNRLDGWISLS